MGSSDGYLELAEAAEALELDAPVDIYGPFYDGISENTFNQFHNVRYRGILNPLEVNNALLGYDALLLPTYHDGEGYPGVILEAYCAGLPVICSRWKFLPEIVDETSGLLITPRDVSSLQSAMLMLQNDDALYNNLRAGAIVKAEKFSTDIWARKFVDMCSSIVNKNNEDHSSQNN